MVEREPMSLPRRPLAIALCGVIAVGLLAVAIDATTIRITPDPASFQVPKYDAFPGARIRVEMDAGWTLVRSSDPSVVAPLGGNWFVAAGLGTATLSAATLRCPRCEMATRLWRVDVRVRIPGT
jgi:hypothetical protein